MMRIANTVVVCLLLIVCLLLAVSASAGIIEHHLYTPISLPSAQGWTYQTSGLDEDVVFELVSDVLVMDTMGDGLDGETFAWYVRSVANADVQSAVLRLRARVTDYEHDALEFYRGFFFGATLRARARGSSTDSRTTPSTSTTATCRISTPAPGTSTR